MTAELTLDDLAARLGHSADWWVKEVRSRKHPHIRVGREYRFTEDDYVKIRESYRPLTAGAPSNELGLTKRSARATRRK